MSDDRTVIEDELLTFLNQEILAAPEGEGCAADDELLLSGIVDSISVMRLVGHVEDAFGVVIPPEDVTIERFETVSAIAGYVIERRGTA